MGRPSKTTVTPVMTTETIVAALASGGIGAILVAIVNGIFSKRKLGAEATEIITRAAAGVVESLERQLKTEREIFNAERDAQRRAWELHIAWDEAVIQKMADAGIKLPPAPNPPPFR